MLITDWLNSIRRFAANRRNRLSIRKARRRRRAGEFNPLVEPLERRQLLTTPTCTSILRSSPSAQDTTATSVSYAVTFSETVTESPPVPSRS